MSVQLKKNEKITLTKDRTINNISVRLGWTFPLYSGEKYDLDASCFALQKNGKTKWDQDFIFYGNLKHPSGGIIHSGDDTSGGGDKDNEIIRVQLLKLPSYVDRIVFVVTIYEATRRMQNFSMIENAFIRVVDETTGNEIVRYDLKEKFNSETAIEVGEIYRDGTDWKFHATGEGFNGGLAEMCEKFGIEVG